jgi:serine protease SohB
MVQALIQLALFAAKALIIVFLVLFILFAFFALAARSKDKFKGRLTIKNLNEKYQETTAELMQTVLSKKLFKKFLKEKKEHDKKKKDHVAKNIFVLNFQGDIKASAVTSLREEVTALLHVATPHDEIVIRLESPGGVVHGYGLAAAQLLRIRDKKIPLTILIDKVAASGGYLMACVANKILAAPFAIVGSIGVIVQLPNFHRLLKNHDIDFEQHMVGDYKRTISVFGENTDEGREKLQEELEDVQRLFKNLITEHRQQLDINKVATGEHWLGQQALALKLIDAIKTSDEYLMERAKEATLYEVCYEVKKSLGSKLSLSAKLFFDKLCLNFLK